MRGKKPYVVIFSFVLTTILFCSCRSIPPLPPVNLAEPGWNTREGQALWTSKRGAPEIVGEIMIATQPDGRAFVQFTKTPLPFVIAQKTRDSWSLEVPLQNKRYAYPGHPPARIIWFQLARQAAHEPLDKDWIWHDSPDGGWRLENSGTGESLEGAFNQ